MFAVKRKYSYMFSGMNEENSSHQKLDLKQKLNLLILPILIHSHHEEVKTFLSSFKIKLLLHFFLILNFIHFSVYTNTAHD